ncbi:haloacid dehalogenase type II [Variovorax sp. PBL-E5]|uniref:haloacid dehalogenase type II n=1 Tax=Variovorax sp. PBL-E5 TaxID=434014 RepID=UPI0013191969|nr:haloacid dehalogenase type II [Variovorax sp. PBL-E5]VTU39394.1 2-haloalkanoic acid dehalogenase [Variovorax sp. PBL-E5]
MRAPSAVLFDAYGTLFDVYSVGALAERFFPGQGTALALLWRDKQIEYTRLVTTSDHGAHYQPFWDLTRAGLRYACARLQLDLNAEREAALMDQYRHLSAFAQARPVLQALRERGVVTGILSNGDRGMLDAAIASAGLDALLDHVISVDPIRKYKTHPDAYRLGVDATGCAAGDIAFVSSNSWDALAATWYGFRTLWINRQGLPFEMLGTAPERIGSELNAVLDFFTAA